jgi:hypothetical protein
VILSSLSENNKRLAQEIGILKERLSDRGHTECPERKEGE